MGFFSIAMAKIVGDKGKVLAVDVQPQMLEVLNRRAARARVDHIILPRLCNDNGIGLDMAADFALLFWAMHEIPDSAGLAREIAAKLKPGGVCFVAEPAFHVQGGTFAAQVNTFAQTGLREIARPKVALSRAAVFKKTGSGGQGSVETREPPRRPLELSTP
jgi:SAM-dependent methyltransferase